MPKLACPCGFVHDLSPIPDNGYLTIADKLYDEVFAKEIVQTEIAKDGLPSDTNSRAEEYDKNSEFLYESSGTLYECPDCGRVMWSKPGSDEFKTYTPEN